MGDVGEEYVERKFSKAKELEKYELMAPYHGENQNCVQVHGLKQQLDQSQM